METGIKLYQFSHGRRPSGRGLWAFELTGTLLGQTTTLRLDVSGAYGQAKREAIRQVSAQGVDVYHVEVLP